MHPSPKIYTKSSNSPHVVDKNFLTCLQKHKSNFSQIQTKMKMHKEEPGKIKTDKEVKCEGFVRN